MCPFLLSLSLISDRIGRLFHVRTPSVVNATRSVFQSVNIASATYGESLSSFLFVVYFCFAREFTRYSLSVFISIRFIQIALPTTFTSILVNVLFFE